MKVLAIGLILLPACSPSASKSDLDNLAARVERLEHPGASNPVSKNNSSETAGPKFSLVVNPRNGDAGTLSFSTLDKCQRARAALITERQNAEASQQAQAAANGVRVYMGGRSLDPVCVEQ